MGRSRSPRWRASLIDPKTLGPWATQYRKKHASDPPPADMPEDERIKEYERRIHELEQKNCGCR